MTELFGIRPVGVVASPLTDPSEAPRQGDEGAPDAWIAIDVAVVEALRGIEAVNGTPVVDLKPVLSRDVAER